MSGRVGLAGTFGVDLEPRVDLLKADEIGLAGVDLLSTEGLLPLYQLGEGFEVEEEEEEEVDADRLEEEEEELGVADDFGLGGSGRELCLLVVPPDDFKPLNNLEFNAEPLVVDEEGADESSSALPSSEEERVTDNLSFSFSFSSPPDELSVGEVMDEVEDERAELLKAGDNLDGPEADFELSLEEDGNFDGLGFTVSSSSFDFLSEVVSPTVLCSSVSSMLAPLSDNPLLLEGGRFDII